MGDLGKMDRQGNLLEETFTFEELTVFLKERKTAPFKLPERLEIVEELPLTPQHEGRQTGAQRRHSKEDQK